MIKDGLTPSKIDQILAKIKPRQIVALVDDDPLTHDLAGRALRDVGYEVQHFKSAEEFLEEFSKSKPDALVIESILSGIGGLAVLDIIRPKSPEEFLPALVLSQKEDIRAKLLAFRRGASDYLIKPFSGEELAVRVRALTRAKIIRELTELSSITDPLTQVYNNRYLLECLDKEIRRIKRYGMESTCLLLGLDSEKSGDDLLKEFSSSLKKNLRGSDTLGRIESGEFFVLLPHTSKEQAMVVARRLRHLAQSSVSMGITTCHSEDTVDPRTLLERTQEALHKAKAVGKGQTAVF